MFLNAGGVSVCVCVCLSVSVHLVLFRIPNFSHEEGGGLLPQLFPQFWSC